MIDEIKKELVGNSDYNVAFSENGAQMFATTGKNILDLSFKAPQLRGTKSHLDNATEMLLMKCDAENRELFVKFLFFLRDVRGGMGERNAFRNLFLWFCDNVEDDAVKLIRFIPEYGRWDDLTYILYNTKSEKVKQTIVTLIAQQFITDLDSENPSLLGKWMPSPNAGKRSKSVAKVLIKEMNNCGFELNEAGYRKRLSELRKRIAIVETNITTKNYAGIDYERVPSVANTRYANLFLKYDEVRRREYLDSLAKGEKKINAGVSFPHDVWKLINREQETAIQMWKNLPDFVNGDCKTLVVRDGSYSMTSTIPNSTTSALDVASALSVYFSERMTGEFHNKFITFSSRPQLVEMKDEWSIVEKKRFLNKYSDCSSTNIERTFQLVLDTAIHNNLKQEDLPKTLLIISDMEFDSARRAYGADANLFNSIAARFAQSGYKMPKLAFWNVNSRTGVIPVVENEMGVTLVSGYSPTVCKMVLSEETDPWKNLLNTLLSERYNQITLG